MATKYLLQCKCGQKWPVETRQAGEELACRCGAKLEVPTLRQLRLLPVAETERAAAPSWNRMRGLIFLGGIVVIAGLATESYRIWSVVHEPVEVARFDERAEDLTSRVDTLTPTEMFNLWQMFDEETRSILGSHDRARAAIEAHQRRVQREIGSVVVFVTLITGLACLVGMFLGMYLVFQKANQPGWASFVPVYNQWVIIKICQQPPLLFLLFFLPCVGQVFGILVAIQLAKLFGKGGGFAAGLILLPFIFLPILGLGDAVYRPIEKP